MKCLKKSQSPKIVSFERSLLMRISVKCFSKALEQYSRLKSVGTPEFKNFLVNMCRFSQVYLIIQKEIRQFNWWYGVEVI